MDIKTKVEINNILNFVQKQIQSATIARNKAEPKSPRYFMLAGKVKAYVDIHAGIVNKFNQKGIDIGLDKKN